MSPADKQRAATVKGLLAQYNARSNPPVQAPRITQSYTAMSNEAMNALFAELPLKYSMELNRTDMILVLLALRRLHDTTRSNPRREHIESFISSIAETVGIEFV